MERVIFGKVNLKKSKHQTLSEIKKHNVGRKKNRGNLDPLLIAFCRTKNKKVKVLYEKKIGVSLGELS